VIEFSERLSYFGIATSLMIYLTKVLQEEMKVAAKNANYWMSVTTLMPLLGGFLADGYLGRFSTVVVSTAVYLLVRGLTNIVYACTAPMRQPIGSQHLISCGGFHFHISPVRRPS
jgi:dipeptide/tripeptide permease